MSGAFPIPHRMPRWKLCAYCAALGLLLSVGILTGCGTTSTTTKTTTPCVPDHSVDAGEVRFWVRDTVALSLVSSVTPFPTVDITALHNTIRILLQNADLSPVQGSETVVVIHQTAMAFAKLAPTSGQDCVARAVDAINQGIAADKGGAQLAGQPSVRLASASPDFYLLQEGMDHIGGSPGGPPSWTPGSSPTVIAPTPRGSGSTVYILDTVDPLPAPSSSGALPALAPSLVPLCLGDSTCRSMVDQLGASGTVDGLYVALPDENIIGPYGPSPTIREHGVFNAAVIHHLAGDATVHLIRVLNDHGVGDLQSLANGLALVHQDPSNPSNVYVNLSLTIVPPVSCLANVLQHYESYESGQNLGECSGSPKSFPPSLDPILATLGRPIADLLSEGHVMVVAAAGNDSRSGVTYDQDLPAAFCGVVAVAAAQTPVKSHWVYPAPPPPPTLDTSSNRPDGQCVQLPAVGNSTPPSQVTGDEAVAVGDNICSLFLQSMTGASGAAVNPLGFAHWSGTSFATAYISGNFAASTIQLNGTGTLDESMPCTP